MVFVFNWVVQVAALLVLMELTGSYELIAILISAFAKASYDPKAFKYTFTYRPQYR
jgi:hypothetical protein